MNRLTLAVMRELYAAEYGSRVKRETVYNISGARTGLADDQRTRVRRYFITMTIRTSCFGAAILAQGVLRWCFLVASAILPWVAVVLGNASRENTAAGAPFVPSIEAKNQNTER